MNFIKFNLKQNSLIIIKLIILFICLYWVFKKIDVQLVYNNFVLMSPKTFLLVLLTLLFQAIMSAWRWGYLSKITIKKIPICDAIRLFMISLFYNQVGISIVVGDGARIIGLTKIKGFDYHASLQSVLIDRFVTLVALLILCLGSHLAIFAIINENSAVKVIFRVLIILVFCCVLNNKLKVEFLSMFVFLVKKSSLLSLNSGRLINSIQSIQSVEFKNYMIVFSISLTIHFLSIVSMQLIAKDILPQWSLYNSVLVMPDILLAATLPISIAGWGVREGVTITAMATYGISAEKAVSISIIYGLFQTLVGLLGVPFIFIKCPNS